MFMLSLSHLLCIRRKVMSTEVKKEAPKAQKPVNKKVKYIWFAVSMVIFAAGIIAAKMGVSLENYAVKAVYAVGVLFPMLVAAQKTSYERTDENGKKRPLIYVLYYFFIVLFIVLIPFIFWVNQFVSL